MSKAKNNLPPVLAIDGPSGSGKGTVGQRCARHLGWHYLDSGAIYRALAWVATQQHVNADDQAQLLSLADQMQLRFVLRENDVAAIEVNGKRVNEALRTEDVAEFASVIAQNLVLRKALLKLQQRQRQMPGLVADGRDMGTVVFADARCKVFLTASAEIRAQRRFEQLKSKGYDVSLARLIESIQARDVRDSNRQASPLIAADDALVVDTSKMGIETVVTRILDHLKTS